MTQPTRAAVQDALRQAQTSFNQGNFSAAEPIYKQMVEAIPPESEEYALCLHNLGEINEQRGNLTTAIWWQTRLLQHDLMQQPGMVNHLFSRMGHIAALYTKAGRPSEANQIYHQMVVLQPRLQQGVPAGFQPQSEIGTFLRGVLDTVHKRYSNDASESEQTNQNLMQLQHIPQPATQSSPLQQFQPGNQAMSNQNQHYGQGDETQSLGPPQGIGGASQGFGGGPGYGAMAGYGAPAGSSAQSSQQNAAPARAFDPRELESIGTPAAKAKSVSRNYQEDAPDAGLQKDDGGPAPKPGRGRRIGIGEVEVAPTEIESKLEGLSNAWTQISNNKFAPLVFLAGLGLGLFVLFHLPYGGNPDLQYKKMPKSFATVDGTKQLEINTPSECAVVINKQKTGYPFKFYFGDLREAVFMSMGQLTEKQYWLSDQKSALVDDRGTAFYASYGPEAKLAKSIELISKTVSDFYQVNRKYPQSAGDIGDAQLQYENPYTEKIETATIQAISVPRSAKGDTARNDFYEQLAMGKGWENEKPLTPGAINCCAAVINGARGPIEAFVIQAGDASGKPLIGANGLAFYKALEDGKAQEMIASETPFFSDGTMRRKMLIILEKPIDSTLSFVIRNASCWLFTILAFFSGCIFLSLPKRSGSKIVVIAFIAIFGLMATLYTICGRF